MATPAPGTDLRLVPMLDYLARMGRRAAETDSGLLRPRQVIALRLLGEQGPVGQGGLAAALNLDASNVVVLLNELEDLGLITRQRDPADRRRHIVALSSKGTRALASASARYRELEDDLFAALSPAERLTLHGLLARAVDGAPEQATAVDDAPSA